MDISPTISIKNIPEDITIDDVKAIKEFEHLSEEQMQKLVDDVKTYCSLYYSHYQRSVGNEKAARNNLIELNHKDQKAA
jgi:hypothetical protein